ncbi:MAG TPA: hypothetical protein VF772_20365 [Terriglobales bacterium]
MRRNICHDCWLKQRPRDFTLSFNHPREICFYCGLLNFHGFYIRDSRKENSHAQAPAQKGEIQIQQK